MTWQQWILVVVFALEGILSILHIEEERPKTTRGVAAAAVVICVLLILMVVGM